MAVILVYQDGRLAEKKTVGGLMGHINGVYMEEWAKRYCAKKKALKPAEPPAQYRRVSMGFRSLMTH